MSYSFASQLGPVPTGAYVPHSVSSLQRVSKYLPGHSFRLHHDPTYAESPSSVGFDTILVYLNAEMEAETQS